MTKVSLQPSLLYSVAVLNGEVVIASPLYKQHFRLRNGGSLEYPEQQLRVWPVRWVDDEVQIAVSHRYKK
jgi:nitrite reductase (NADH) small subunit